MMLAYESESTTKMKQLSVWNPLDHLRLLWWVLMTPSQLAIHREIFGEKAERSVSSWFFSTLAQLPFLVIMLFNLLDDWYDFKPGNYISLTIWTLGLISTWLIGGQVGHRYSVGVIIGQRLGWGLVSAIGMVAITATLFNASNAAANTFMGSLVGSLIFFLVITGLMMYLTYSKLPPVIEKSLEDSLKTGRPSWLVRGIFGAVVLAYTVLIWISFLGGWRVFR